MHTPWMHIQITRIVYSDRMGWLHVVGSFKLLVSFAKEPHERDDILQKRPIILRSLLIVASPENIQVIGILITWIAYTMHMMHTQCMYDAMHAHAMHTQCMYDLHTHCIRLYSSCIRFLRVRSERMCCVLRSHHIISERRCAFLITCAFTNHTRKTRMHMCDLHTQCIQIYNF